MPAPQVEMRESTFTGSGEVTLFRRTWTPSGPGRAGLRGVVVLAHGLGEHCGRYDHVARRLAGHGFAVWALDHRGHGRSDGRRVHVASFGHFEADLERLRRDATATHPGVPCVVLGHSMGGAIALGHALDYPGHADALILTGPLTDAAHGVPAPVVVAGRIVAKVLPTLPLVRLDGAAISRDPAVVAAYRADPLVHAGRVTVGLGAQLVARTSRFRSEVGRLSVPVLVVHGTADTLVPVATSRALVPRFGSPDVTFVEEDGLYHEVLNEPEKDRVLDTLVAWLDERFPTTEGWT